MATVSVYNMDGQTVGTMDLSEAVFNAPVKENLVHQAVVQYLANKRQGTQKPAAASSRGDRRARAMRDRAPSARRSGVTAVWFLHRHRGTIPSR